MGSTTTPPLESGWLRDTPVEDTLLRRFVHNQAAHNGVLADAHGGRAHRADGVFLTDTGSPVPFLNQAVLARPLTGLDDDVLDRVDSFFDPVDNATLLSIWPTPDLTARGWSLIGHPAVVARSPAPLAHYDAPAVQVRRAATAADFEAAERIVVEGYPLDEARHGPVGSVLPPALAGTDLEVRVGVLDGDPVGVGNVFVAQGLVNLSLGATLPAARRRGVWEALVWARVATAPDLPAIAYTSDLSRPGFIRMGFLPLTRFTLWARGRPPARLAAALPSVRRGTARGDRT
ncbi:MAG: hypothetical protein M3425_03800 [Actinomycetota bacterium]|nr:hypothetical protein [Actinomycetota bacterium]MDQ3529063.1 hypothetical protein [Actinomycetota bacterium]